MNFTSESVPMVFSAFLEYGLWFPNVLWPGSAGTYSSTQGQSLDWLALAIRISKTSQGVEFAPQKQAVKNILPAADKQITKPLKILLVNKSIYQLIICNKLMQLPAEPLTVIVLTICLLKYHSSSAMRSRRQEISTQMHNLQAFE